MTDREALVTLAREVAAAIPSMEEVGHLEERLHALDRGLPGYEDFEVALISYRPGGGDHRLDEAQLQQAARLLLHELGEHDLCLHDVPLMERP